MGATGTGKSRLSIDLATRFFSSEIINSDKIQLYRGLDITTNKIPLQDRLGVPHHLLGVFDSDLIEELTPSQYRLHASSIIEDILGRNKLPLIVGGSNSLIHALVSDRFDPNSDVFNDVDSILSSELRYDCCFLWVDVGIEVLYEYLLRRVDDMFDSGMFEELVEFFESEAESGPIQQFGIKKAIGIPEFEDFFRSGGGGDDTVDTQLKERAIQAIKYNTCELAKRQIEKIQRLRSAGWDLRRLIATEAFRAVLLSDSDMSSEIWEKNVVEPSVKIVKTFLEE
ncbi:tRNA dimethylallyltransferase [Thalictrum thalictroides]|uniref:tRNA dimethylallyltransferase n=1 Tax=Thalictrum thalictroides TaxID=46969 RepID=A0A7J6UZI7_THATH|nr:tRNA dimethylallyltransferase [Thalictrum thalictroides]